jgi:hypothetical protein
MQPSLSILFAVSRVTLNALIYKAPSFIVLLIQPQVLRHRVLDWTRPRKRSYT